MAYDPLFIQFIYYFNVERDYFECHEVLEELWLEEGRSPLFQGLLQIAVGLYHARNDNTSGAIKLFNQALNKLTRYPDHQLGIDMDKLLKDSQQYLADLVQHDDKQIPFDFYDIDIVITDPYLKSTVNDSRIENK